MTENILNPTRSAQSPENQAESCETQAVKRDDKSTELHKQQRTFRQITAAPTSEELTVHDLINNSEAISPETQVSVLAERFYAEKELDALPLVKNGFPCGLASRSKILTTLAIRFGFALYGKKPIRVIADMDPLIVRHNDSVEQVLDQAMLRDFRDIYDEILVINDQDKYIGRLSVKRLIVEQGNCLTQSMAQRQLALAKAAEMEKMDAMKTSFMAHVTHELRNPVHAIIGLTELMELNFGQQKTDDFPKYLSLLSTSAINLRAIINNILDLSKIEAGRMEIIVENFSLGDLLDDVLETGRVLNADKPVIFEIECENPSLVLNADRVKIRQILLNLVSNAIKYTDRGFIILNVESNGSLLLSVRDTGIGIKKADLHHLFEAFNQLEDAKTRRYAGTGLGLSITRQMVHLLGGTIQVESTFGIGSRFDVSLPYTPLTEENHDESNENCPDC